MRLIVFLRDQITKKEREEGMKINRMVPCFTALVFALAESSASAALTQNYTKTAGSYNWSDTTIWSLGTLPTAANSAQIRKGTILNGDTDATVGEIRIFESSTFSAGKDITVNGGVGENSYTLVGVATTGTLNVVTGGSLTGPRVYYGYTGRGYGTISGGTLTAPDLYIANGATTVADVTQTGGNVIAKNSVHLNYTAGANGIYHLQDGTLTTGVLAFRNKSGAINAFDWTGGTLKTASINYLTENNPAFNQSAGILDPTKFNGDGSVNEISTLNFNASVGAASYTLSGTGQLKMQLAGTSAGISYDQLLVEGGFTAGGTLDVTLINGFNVTQGDSFNIIDAATFAGQFSQVNLPTLTGGLGWNTDQLATAGILEVVAIPEPTTLGLFLISGIGTLFCRRRLRNT